MRSTIHSTTFSRPLTPGVVAAWLDTTAAPDAVGFCFKTNRPRPTEASP